MKKIMISVLAALAIGNSLYGFDLKVNVNFENGYVYDQDFIANKASYLVSPVDINFSDIQKHMNENESVYIFPYFGTPDKINAEFGINIVAYIKLTKNSITYHIYHNGRTDDFNDVNTFKKSLEDYASQITDDSTKKSNFEGDYITQATSNYIIHNKLYAIQTTQNSSVTVPVPTAATTTSDINNSIFPPSLGK